MCVVQMAAGDADSLFLLLEGRSRADAFKV